MNATYSGWRGSIMVALNELLCWDQYFAVGGALRHVTFDPTPGTLNSCTIPLLFQQLLYNRWRSLSIQPQRAIKNDLP